MESLDCETLVLVEPRTPIERALDRGNAMISQG
jgi:hypothetical protein